MKKLLVPICIMLMLAGFLLAQPVARADDSADGDKPLALVVDINGIISPATYDLVHRSLKEASDRKADIVVLQIQTPGGLYDSMQQIIQDILDSPVPVATFVAPSGSRAASAGTYILYGSHIAAMTPTSNIGAATPIQMTSGGEVPPPDKTDPSIITNPNDNPAHPKTTLEQKMVNDAAAYIRGLAELRGRNAEWAERAVREAESIDTTEALSKKAIDVVADDVPDLLNKIDGRTVKMSHGKTMKLRTAGGKIEKIDPDWRTDLLNVIAHPNVAFLLMTIGSYGLIYECISPGAVLPGVVGIISFILGLYAMNVLPIDYTGLALMLTGIALMIAEAFAPSFGALGIGGAISFAVGGTMLINSSDPNFGIDPWLIAAVTLVSLGFLSVLMAVVFRAHRRPTTTGMEELKASIAEVVSWSQGQGEVRVTGEIWKASSASPDFIINPGDKVRVLEIDGLRLVVEPVK